MRKAAKITAMFLSLVLLLTCTTACAKKTEKKPSGESIVEGTTYNPDAETQLTWMHIEDYQEVNDELVKQYVELHPEIGVTTIWVNAFEYDDALTTRAAAKKLPDAFWTINLPETVIKDWCYDMTEMFNNDPDTAMIYPNYKEVGVFSDKRMGMAIYSQPYVAYLNRNVFERYNMPMPGYDWTFDEALKIAEEITHPEEHYYGLGKATYFNLDNLPRIINILKTDNMTDYGFIEGEGYNFNQNWIDMVYKRNEMHTQGVYETMTWEEKEAEFGTSNVWTVVEGRTAIDLGFLYEQWTILYDSGINKGVEFEMYPYPKGTSDYIPGGLLMATIAKNTPYPQESYELLKFLTWSREGWSRRADAFVEIGKTPNLLPIIDDVTLWAELKEKLAPDDPGFQAVMDTVPYCKLEVGLRIPGWQQFEQWVNDNGFFDGMLAWEEPTVDPADVAAQLTEKANEYYFDALKQIEEMLNK